MKAKYFVMTVFIIALSGCDMLGKTLEQEDMNLYFYSPDGEEAYLGVHRGIHTCRDFATNKAQQLGYEGDGGRPVDPPKNTQIPVDETNTSVGSGAWTYHCCWKTTTTTCKAELK